MKAITVETSKPGSVRFEDIPEPDIRDGSVLVESVAVGVCGTDVEIAQGRTAGPLRVKRGLCWVMNQLAACSTRVQQAA